MLLKTLSQLMCMAGKMLENILKWGCCRFPKGTAFDRRNKMSTPRMQSPEGKESVSQGIRLTNYTCALLASWFGNVVNY